MSNAAIIPLNPTTEPTDRSMPPEIMTKVIPIATTPTMDVCLTRLVRFSTVKKNSEPIESEITRKTIIAARVPSGAKIRLALKNLIIFSGRP